uniref:FAD-linked oxidoreductase ffsJ n=1 Tax=Aspergillus flavipes TaxID=41900 RepID=FFSJ_ASPFV|nr:RecName: Full=FAD-linked oxidoreductase ffsJ; AltName: Full=Cytochalasans biosynthesis cluster protein ffsJ; Flags: Precursor [Aspergillus flavipes]QOG08949.1 FfsJ [Aspergillus flavipes]
MRLTRALTPAILALPAAHAAASLQDWQSLNTTLDHRLHAVTPLALPCFSIYNNHSHAPNEDACLNIQDHYTNASYRVDQVSAYVFSQSETCSPIPSQQCELDPSDPSNPAAYTNISCNTGSLPAYYIDVQHASDVTAAFHFAAKTNTAISIKNSGHDYNGRSSGPGSLSLRTRTLRSTTYHPSFTPASCKTPTGKAVTLGAGVNFHEVYTFAHENKVTFVGGSGPTVGASGGWVLTGGHGVLSRAYGLGIDRVVEFELVTPDGEHRIANACQNADLFWALRGGGGSTFGVVLSSTHRVEPEAPLSLAYLALPPNASSSTSAAFLDLLVNYTLPWAEDAWGGFGNAAATILATPLLSLPEAKTSMATAIDFVTAHGGTGYVETLSSFYEMYTKYIVPSASAVGSVRFNHNWIIPNSLFATASGQKKLRKHLDWMGSVGLVPGLLETTPYLYSGNGHGRSNNNNSNNSSTSTSTSTSSKNGSVKPYAYGGKETTSSTPAWRNSAAVLIAEVGWAFNATLSEKKALAKTLVEASERVRELAPGSGAYANEAHPWVEDWQDAFWGGNYRRLADLKKKWDPKGLLGCWHCVGSEGEGKKETGTAWRAEVVGGKCLGRLI